MKFACPYCHHSMNLKRVKVGSFKPTCKKCGEMFRLKIREGAEEAEVFQLKSASASPQSESQSKVRAKAEPVASSPTVRGDLEETREVDRSRDPSPGLAGAPTQLGGYRIIKAIGAGAMGSVYLARQLSLDRDVALKTIQAKWAENPRLNARFVREAYAAAQLTHHNVVQVYDFGSDNNLNYFSMELVSGGSLSDYVKKNGKPDVETAVGFVLQAARGLQFAHQHGMVHRDVKPANLMLTEYGIVKVADLGLVKIPTELEDEAESEMEGTNEALADAKANVTMANAGVGTASYMAPEQATNARGVDHRADIYALGCTLYSLLIGRPPFRGTTALEVISKHRTEPIRRLEEVDPSFPAALSDILQKMVAKRAKDRFGSMGEVIEALEGFLSQGGPRFPTAEHEQAAKQVAEEYRASAAAKTRIAVLTYLPLGCLVLAIAVAFFRLSWSAALVSLAVGFVVSYFVLHGLREQGPLFLKFREFVATSSWGQRLTWMVAGLLLLVAGFVTGTLFLGAIFAALGVAAGVGIQIGMDGQVRKQRAACLERLRSVLRELRMAGLAEEDVHEFVAAQSGSHWEDLFEEVFGFEAKLAMRERLRDGKRPRFQAWREPLIRILESRIQAIKKQRDIQQLQKVEARGLKEQGVSSAQAAAQAERMAAALVDHAKEQQPAPPPEDRQTTAIDPAELAARKRARIKAMLAEACGGNEGRRRRSPVTGLLNLCFGARVRFVLAATLLAGFLLWVHQNDLASPDNRGAWTTILKGDPGETSPLSWPLIGEYFDSLNPGLAGLILLMASFYHGWRVSMFVLPAALLIVAGADFGVPSALGLTAKTICAMAGGAVGLVGLFLSRE